MAGGEGRRAGRDGSGRDKDKLWDRTSGNCDGRGLAKRLRPHSLIVRRDLLRQHNLLRLHAPLPDTTSSGRRNSTATRSKDG